MSGRRAMTLRYASIAAAVRLPRCSSIPCIISRSTSIRRLGSSSAVYAAFRGADPDSIWNHAQITQPVAADLYGMVLSGVVTSW